ncbi:MAG: GNAT family N-acetyltransferase [Pseudomonadota bacterium]
MTQPPMLSSERILLRALGPSDIEAYKEFYADGEASAFYGGPLSAGDAWRRLAADIGHWTLRGYGHWAVVTRDDGRTIGVCGLYLPEGWGRPELTWWILPRARRKGYAEEASRLAIRFGYDVLNWRQVETYMNDDNEAAQRLVMKLGGRIIAREMFPDGLERSVYALPRALDGASQ